MKFLLSLLISIFLIGCTAQTSNIQKIEYEAGACFGFCPMFKITINPDRSAVIEAEKFTFSNPKSKDWTGPTPEGAFTATIRETEYNQLVKLLNEANLKSLKNFYGNKNVTDLPTSHLKVTYKDGTSKHIEDYGKGGTPELDAIYQFIEDLRSNQTWTKIK